MKGDLEGLRAKLLSQDVTMTSLHDGSGVLVNLSGMEILTFNETGMLLCRRLLDGLTDVESLALAIVEEFEVGPAVATASTIEFLNHLEFALKPKGPVSP